MDWSARTVVQLTRLTMAMSFGPIVQIDLSVTLIANRSTSVYIESSSVAI